jgi:ribosomal protein L37E
LLSSRPGASDVYGLRVYVHVQCRGDSVRAVELTRKMGALPTGAAIRHSEFVIDSPFGLRDSAFANSPARLRVAPGNSTLAHASGSRQLRVAGGCFPLVACRYVASRLARNSTFRETRRVNTVLRRRKWLKDKAIGVGKHAKNAFQNVLKRSDSSNAVQRRPATFTGVQGCSRPSWHVAKTRPAVCGWGRFAVEYRPTRMSTEESIA